MGRANRYSGVASATAAHRTWTPSRPAPFLLLDAGLPFEGFFQQSARLVLPAFAFLTFHSVCIIPFGAIHTIMDRFMAEPNFVIEGVRRDISLAEGIHFSIVTFATVGYGDIHPVSGPVRLVLLHRDHHGGAAASVRLQRSSAMPGGRMPGPQRSSLKAGDIRA